jgi:hypothetical protein
MLYTIPLKFRMQVNPAYEAKDEILTADKACRKDAGLILPTEPKTKS